MFIKILKNIEEKMLLILTFLKILRNVSRNLIFAHEILSENGQFVVIQIAFSKCRPSFQT